ncbi:hypothetical protein HN014_00945 [Aquimarina sp. TRL1]|uniref:hypothetical protein n=1 Tax=Aquimarina sp. (strain TRL1) TaxID=2736252 RepID=UPI00158C6C8E|nr:hypothetical protein [Aquimarina sp. TRL1]QKX03539.1 hypothetical protein HN014_00945 [Aquimarina sp. TRL1]
MLSLSSLSVFLNRNYSISAIKIYVLAVFVFYTFSATAQIDANSVMGLPTTATTVEMNGITGVAEGSLLYNIETKKIYIFDGTNWVSTTNDNWLIDGNNGIASTSFLGTQDDIAMDIRSNNISILEFGRRQTLGLEQAFEDYDDPDQYLTYVKGNNGVSALQFQANAASFYKPMFFTNSDGNFRLKGSAAGTDFFEVGSNGVSNNGELEFIIGDDGAEPFIFKRYDYRDRTKKELMRIQGSANALTAKPRVGINTGTLANSTLQVAGSVATSIVTPTTNITLTEDHHTVIITTTLSTTLPAANTVNGRIYVIKNTTATTQAISSYRDANNTAQTTVPRSSILWLQSDGTNWQQIGNTGTVTTTSTILVDQSFIWAGQVDDADIHSNATLDVTQTRSDTGWTFAAPSTITYTGTPDHVKINLMAVANNTGNHWPLPHVRVFRNGVQIGEGSEKFLDDSGTYSGRSTVVINMIDSNPGTNPVYTFTTLEDDNRTMNNPTIPDLSPISLIAVEKVAVVRL